MDKIDKSIIVLQVLLRDQLDDNVIPVVEELRRRLKSISTAHEGQGDEDSPLQEGEEMGDEDGKHYITSNEGFIAYLKLPNYSVAEK